MLSDHCNVASANMRCLEQLTRNLEQGTLLLLDGREDIGDKLLTHLVRLLHRSVPHMNQLDEAINYIGLEEPSVASAIRVGRDQLATKLNELHRDVETILDRSRRPKAPIVQARLLMRTSTH